MDERLGRLRMWEETEGKGTTIKETMEHAPTLRSGSHAKAHKTGLHPRAGVSRSVTVAPPPGQGGS